MIIHEDEHLIAVAKPAGRLVIPGRGPAKGRPLVEEVSKLIGAKAYVVHRIDRETSGLVLFAKDANSHRFLSKAFERRSVRKTYLALAQGAVERGGLVRAPIRAFGSGRVGVDRRGDPCETGYRVRDRLHGATLLAVEPKTGRRHQIRVHLYSIGHPVMGDPLYGRPRPVGGVPRLMLHALALEFESPSGRLLSLRAGPPSDFLEIIEDFRRKTGRTC
ncbi:MAG: RluA family pseudouridine synthase [Elusimicrobiota bacterium]